jgi:DNA modification methylase
MNKRAQQTEEQQATYPRFVGELWTSEQRQMHSMHYVISYRASFKPELPDYCIRKYSEAGDVVLDPFGGRGTTALQAALLGRIPWSSDINPLSQRLVRAKLNPARLDEVVLALNEVDFRRPVTLTGYKELFQPFYHPDTYRELINLKQAIKRNQTSVFQFIELVALSRLHGHSPGFFSVYSFPQISIPPESQRTINARRHQEPEYRAVAPRIIRKAAQALRDGFTSQYSQLAGQSRVEIADSRKLHYASDQSVDLIVSSPPFLDKVDYLTDNWLEMWFADVKQESCSDNLVMSRALSDWAMFMEDVMAEMLRVLKPGGRAVIEVGEVETSAGMIYLDEVVAELAEHLRVGERRFRVEEVLINQQEFTKLANCFKVDNNRKGTNTNRLVVLKASSVRQAKPKPIFGEKGTPASKTKTRSS